MHTVIGRTMFSLSFALALLGMPFGALAATFIVAPGGDDANPGTSKKTLLTLEAARDAARKAGAGPHTIKVVNRGQISAFNILLT